MMIICTECKTQLNMSKMGVWVVQHNLEGDVNRIYRGDLYECQEHGFHVLTDFGRAITPFNHSGSEAGFKTLVSAVMNDEYFTMLDEDA